MPRAKLGIAYETNTTTLEKASNACLCRRAFAMPSGMHTMYVRMNEVRPNHIETGMRVFMSCHAVLFG